MKKILIGLTLLASISAFSNTKCHLHVDRTIKQVVETEAFSHRNRSSRNAYQKARTKCIKAKNFNDCGPITPSTYDKYCVSDFQGSIFGSSLEFLCTVTGKKIDFIQKSQQEIQNERCNKIDSCIEASLVDPSLEKSELEKLIFLRDESGC